MKHYTSEEAVAIISHAQLGMIERGGRNPNTEALQAAIEYSHESFPRDVTWGVCMGFVLGLAIGKQQERERRRLTRERAAMPETGTQDVTAVERCSIA